LSSERKRADQLQSKLQDFIQEVKVKQSKKKKLGNRNINSDLENQ